MVRLVPIQEPQQSAAQARLVPVGQAPAPAAVADGQVSNVAAKQGRLDVGAPGQSALGFDLPGGGAVTDAGGLPAELTGAAREFVGGLSVNLGEEAEARIRAIGGSTVDEELASVRAEMEQFRAENPTIAAVANVGGALMTAALPAGAVVRGGSLLSKAARGAGAGAAFSAASEFGAGEGGVEPRLERAAEGARSGAAIGAAIPFAGRTIAEGLKLLRNRATNAETLNVLRETGRAALQRAENSGLVLKPGAFAGFVNNIGPKAVKDLDPDLSPRAFRAFQRLENLASAQVGIGALMDERQLINKLIRKTSDDFDRDVLRKLRESLDGFLDNLGPRTVASGNSKEAVAFLREGNRLWRQFRRGDVIERTVERARNSQQLSFENALKGEFKRLVKNEKEMRLFNKTERKAIQRAKRRGVISGPLAAIGKFSPTGFFPQAAALGSVAAVGPAGLALPAIGGAARQAATVAARRRAQQAFETAAGGGQRVAAPALPQTVDQALATLLLGQTAASPGRVGQAGASPRIPVQ